MKPIDSSKLQEHIALPDWEKSLLPLFLFRGSQPYRLRALWNIAYAMYLAEADSVFDGQRVLVPDEDHGKLCGILNPPTLNGLRGIFGRLRGCKALSDSVSKAFTEYIEYIHPAQCIYTPVPYEAERADRKAWWRGVKRPDRKLFKLPEAKSHERAYPYVQSKTPEQELVAEIYALVPKSIPIEIRGDLCQDLIVGVLSGETTVANIPNVIAKYAAKARKIMPDRWKTISIDAELPGTDGMHFLDTLERSTEDFAPDLIEAISEAEDEHGVPAAFWRQKGVNPREVGGDTTRFNPGDRVRVREECFKFFPLVAQSRLFGRVGVVTGRGTNTRAGEVEFPAWNGKKTVKESIPWPLLERSQ